MKELQKFEFEGNEITFLPGENIMINATQMAKKFNARTESWLRTDSAQRMIEALSITHKCVLTDLVIVKNGGANPGTWFHEDVALVFAQWLSPEFYIWCNDRIKELFKYGYTARTEESRVKLFKLSEAASTIKGLYPYNIGKYKIYEELRQRGILDVHNKPQQKYIDLGYFGYRYYREDEYPRYPVVTEEGMKWLTQFLFPQATDGGKLSTIEYRLNLALRGVGIMLESILISKSGSQSTPEQNKITVDKMRAICTEIKGISDDTSDLPNPVQLTMKLDKY
jgi:hypothetical protein